MLRAFAATALTAKSKALTANAANVTGQPVPPERAARVAATKSGPLEIAPASAPDNSGSLDDVERRHIESVLSQTNWMIAGERGAAKILDLNPSTLRSRMQKLGIKRPERASA